MKVRVKKKNPRRIPASMQDVKKAAKDGSDRGVKLALAIMLIVLKDDFDFTEYQIKRVWERVEKLSGEVAEGRISVNDLCGALLDDYNIDLT